MLLKVTSKRQVTFPKTVMDEFNIRPGDVLQVTPTSEGLLVRPHRLNEAALAPLRGELDPSLPPPDLRKIRHAILDPTLRS